jgi:hypothetical protein
MNWTMDASAPTHTTDPDYAAFLQQQLWPPSRTT